MCPCAPVAPRHAPPPPHVCRPRAACSSVAPPHGAAPAPAPGGAPAVESAGAPAPPPPPAPRPQRPGPARRPRLGRSKNLPSAQPRTPRPPAERARAARAPARAGAPRGARGAAAAHTRAGSNVSAPRPLRVCVDRRAGRSDRRAPRRRRWGRGSARRAAGTAKNANLGRGRRAVGAAPPAQEAAAAPVPPVNQTLARAAGKARRSARARPAWRAFPRLAPTRANGCTASGAVDGARAGRYVHGAQALPAGRPRAGEPARGWSATGGDPEGPPRGARGITCKQRGLLVVPLAAAPGWAPAAAAAGATNRGSTRRGRAGHAPRGPVPRTRAAPGRATPPR
jgi:hypothetical protein